jgi:hypothetical protein
MVNNIQGSRTGGLYLTVIQGGRVRSVMNTYVNMQFIECETKHYGSIESKLTEITNSLFQRSEKEIGLKLVNKFNAFYVKQVFIATFKKPPPILSLSQNNPVRDSHHIP